MFPIGLLLAVATGYAAAVLFFFARALGTRPRSLVFVLLGVVAALLTRRFKPKGNLVVLALFLTFASNTAAAVLLFLPINERIPFYVNEVPKWVLLW